MPTWTCRGARLKRCEPDCEFQEQRPVQLYPKAARGPDNAQETFLIEDIKEMAEQSQLSRDPKPTAAHSPCPTWSTLPNPED